MCVVCFLCALLMLTDASSTVLVVRERSSTGDRSRLQCITLDRRTRPPSYLCTRHPTDRRTCAFRSEAQDQLCTQSLHQPLRVRSKNACTSRRCCLFKGDHVILGHRCAPKTEKVWGGASSHGIQSTPDAQSRSNARARRGTCRNGARRTHFHF